MRPNGRPVRTRSRSVTDGWSEPIDGVLASVICVMVTAPPETSCRVRLALGAF